MCGNRGFADLFHTGRGEYGGNKISEFLYYEDVMRADAQRKGSDGLEARKRIDKARLSQKK